MRNPSYQPPVRGLIGFRPRREIPKAGGIEARLKALGVKKGVR